MADQWITPNSTAWVDRHLSNYWGSIEAVAPDHLWLPHAEIKTTRTGKRKVVAEELGCGHYGCVMPTGSPDRVFKMTGDVAEAAFVRAALEIGNFPAGIVKYDSIYQLKGARLRKRPIFVLWRQEADDIGFLTVDLRRGDTSEARVATEAARLVANAQIAGAYVREWLRKGKPVEGVRKYAQMAWNVVGENYELIEKSPTPMQWEERASVQTVIQRYRGAERAAVALRFFEAAAEMMRHNSPVVYTVGEALEFYLEHNILLADVHLNNIGKTQHEDYEGAVVTITDPGHAVFLDDRYDGLKIEELEPDA